MKIIWGLAAVIAVNCIVNAQAGECDKFVAPGGRIGGGACCKIPVFKDAALIEKIVNDLRTKEPNITAPALGECKVLEQLLTEKKLLKDKEIDKEASLKYIETAVDDAKWKDAMKASFEICYKEVNEKITEIQEKLEKAPPNQGGVKKDQCNIKALAINACMIMETIFKKCPEEYMAKDKDCNSLREWMGKCRNTISSMGEFGSRMSK